MTAASMVSFRVPQLAWSASSEDDARFRRVLHRVLAVTTVLCLASLWWPVSPPDRSALPPVPQRLARLLLDNEPKPLPPPPPVAKALPRIDTPSPPQATPANKPQPPKPEAARKAPAVPEARNPQPNKPPGEAIGEARKAAAGVGLLAMKDELAEIRGAPLAVQLNKDIKQGAGVGSGSGPGVGAGKEAGLPVRAMLTSNAAGGSGGINTAGYSRDTGGGGLAGRATTLVEGVAGGGGGGGAGGSLQRSGSGKASRSIEEIKLVFERNKGAIYAIYNRALRDDPALQGKVVVELKIAPSGEVVEARVVSSELHAAELEAKLLARIHQFSFGAKDVEQMVVSWPVDFLPS